MNSLRYFYRLSFLIALFGSEAFAQRVRPLDAIAAKLEPSKTVVYKKVGDRSLRLFVFEPDGHQPTDQRPVFLAIHGGGWTGGTPRWFYPLADHFAQQGMLAISLEYRLMNKQRGTTVFDCVKDTHSAVRYLREHAAQLGIDPQRIVIAGASAGGHLAVGTELFDEVNSAEDNLKTSCKPNALILIYPVIDTSEQGYGQKKIGDQWKALSPVDHVHQGVPPTLIFHGTGDTVTPFPGAQRFQDLMLSAGNHCELIPHPGGQHGYLIFDLKLYEAGLKRMEKFLREQKMLGE
ncbi:MAG: alpha/beta hydrolase [Planctomicrobium sp.]|jgi:acetyl esterase|nr:alpha/beta hydrolase [Planctomicrobium sp.]